MARKPSVQALIKKLKARGSLDLYWTSKYGDIGLRTLHWVNNKEVMVSYNRILPPLNTLPLRGFIENLIFDDEIYANYWLAYGAQLRKQHRDE